MTGDELKALRISKGFTHRSDLAKVIVHDVDSIRKWETGKRRVPDWLVKFLNGEMKLPRLGRRTAKPTI